MSDVEAAGRARAAFAGLFGSDADGVWAAPGRVNVIGEHTDYNDGFVLPVALEPATWVCGRPADGVLRLDSLDRPGTVEVDLATGAGPTEGWGRYVTAVVRALRDADADLRGFAGVLASDLPALDDAERDAFVEVYLDVLGRFARRFDTPMPYISSWNQAPLRAGREDWWLHLQLFSFRRAPGKLKYLAGSESGMGAFITDTNPEDVAEQLRAVVVA